MESAFPTQENEGKREVYGGATDCKPIVFFAKRKGVRPACRRCRTYADDLRSKAPASRTHSIRFAISGICLKQFRSPNIQSRLLRFLNLRPWRIYIWIL